MSIRNHRVLCVSNSHPNFLNAIEISPELLAQALNMNSVCPHSLFHSHLLSHDDCVAKCELSCQNALSSRVSSGDDDSWRFSPLSCYSMIPCDYHCRRYFARWQNLSYEWSLNYRSEVFQTHSLRANGLSCCFWRVNFASHLMKLRIFQCYLEYPCVWSIDGQFCIHKCRRDRVESKHYYRDQVSYNHPMTTDEHPKIEV